MHYFSYGSNMDSATLRAYCPGAAALGAAELRGYQLEFNVFSPTRGCGVADIVPVGSAVVWGALYEVPDAELAALYTMETPEGGTPLYAPFAVTVRPGGDALRAVSARTYAAVLKDPGQRPSPEYLALLLGGAREHGLPEEYIGWLAQLPTAPGRLPAAAL